MKTRKIKSDSFVLVLYDFLPERFSISRLNKVLLPEFRKIHHRSAHVNVTAFQSLIDLGWIRPTVVCSLQEIGSLAQVYEKVPITADHRPYEPDVETQG